MKNKKIAIMQPYFMPYLGYISLIKHTNLFILLDQVNFIRHGWIERNRILKPDNGWQYIKVPLIKHSREILIKDIRIRTDENWQNKILTQVNHYKKRSPYFNQTINFLNEIFSINFTDIVNYNRYSLEQICKYLNISTPIYIFSDMNLDIESANAPDEWALNICKSLGNVEEYWNPCGGISFFDPLKYKNNNIELKFHRINLAEYDQKREQFEPGLSIIDVMMFNSKEEINNMLDNYELC